MNSLYVIYFFAIISIGCTKDYPCVPDENENPPFSNFISRNLVWKTQLYEPGIDTFGYTMGGPFLFEDKVVFSKGYLDPFPREIFVAIDLKKEYAILWQLQPEPSYYSRGRRNTQKFNDNIIHPQGGKFNLINTTTATWESYSFDRPNTDFHARIETYNSKVYIPSTSADLHSSNLHEIDLEENKITNLDTISEGNEVKHAFEPLVVSKNKSGNDIIYYVSRNRTSPGTGWLDLFAMDLSVRNESNAGMILWHKTDFDPLDKNCNVIAPPKIINDTMLVFLAEHHVYGIHTESGKTLFKSDYFANHLIITDIGFYESEIVILDSHKNLISISAVTGETVGITRDMGGNVSKFEIYDGLLYYTSTGDGKLYVYDLVKRKKIYALKSPFKDEFNFADFSSTTLLIDHETGILYVSDRAYAMAIQL